MSEKLNNKVDALDVSLMTENGDFVSLPQVAAAGCLYIRNGRGEFEQVRVAMYWRKDHLFSTWSSGAEVDENGETTRIFQAGGQ